MAKKQSAAVQKLMKKASDALQRKNYGLALITYQQLLNAQPSNIEIRTAFRATQTRNARENGTKGLKSTIATYKAKLFYALKKFDAAMKICDQGITADPENTTLLTLFSDCALELEYTELAAWQRQYVADNIDPDDIDNLYNLADIYVEIEQAGAAIACYERIKDIDPRADVDQEMRNVSAAISSLDYEKAAREGSREIVKDKDEAEALELDAGKLRTDEQRHKAIQWRLDHDLVDRPNDSAIWIAIGDIAMQMDNWKEGYALATEYYKKAEELNPQNSTIRDKLGDLQIKHFKVQQSIIQKKLKANPEDADLKNKLVAIKKKDLNFQLKDYERRIKDQPMKADFRFRLGQLYMQFKRYDDAIAQLQQSCKDPRFTIASYTNMGRCMMETDQADYAVKQFEKARQGVELFDKYKEPLYFEAQAYEQLGDIEKSLALYTEIYESDINYKDVKVKVPALRKQLKG